MRTRFVGPRESYPKRHHDRFIGFAGLTDMTNTRTHGPRKVQTQTETRRVYALRAGDGTLELNKKLCYRRRTARRAVLYSVVILSTVETSCTTNPQQIAVMELDGYS